MKTVFISQRLGNNICAKTHLKAFESLLSKEELLIIDLNPNENRRREKNHIYFGGFNKLDKIKWIVQQTTWYLTNDRISKICRYIDEFCPEIVFIDDSCFGKLEKAIKLKFPQVKVITFYHDIIADLYQQKVKTNGMKYKLLMHYAALKGERLNQKYSDMHFVLNKRDALLFKKHYKKSPDGLLPMAVAEPNLENKVAVEYDFCKAKEENRRIILFVGAFYKPNLDGLRWFVDNVFTELDEKYLLLVIGRGLEKIRSDYRDVKNIMIIGGVEQLAPFYNNADIIVAPIFSGGGMKQKTAEAFAYGKTFIGTTESMQGYEEELDLLDKEFKIVFSCDTREEQLDAFRYIEKNKVYDFHEVLNLAYKRKYSSKALEKILKGIY